MKMGFKDKFIKFQELSVNKNIILRQVDPKKDLLEYHKIFSDMDTFRYYTGAEKSPPDVNKVSRILENQINAFEKMREYIWTIAEKKSGKALGRIHFSDFEYDNKIANIGYWLGRESWGKGIISACIKPVVDFGFSYLELERIYTTVHVENIASWKALEKNGFKREGLLRHCFSLREGLCDCYMYSRIFTDVPKEA